MFKIEGLDALQKQLKQAEKAFAELDGDIADVRFDPHDPSSIEQAIQQVNDAVDEKVAPYTGNEMVMSVAEELKENARAEILERAAQARLNPEDDDDD